MTAAYLLAVYTIARGLSTMGAGRIVRGLHWRYARVNNTQSKLGPTPCIGLVFESDAYPSRQKSIRKAPPYSPESGM